MPLGSAKFDQSKSPLGRGKGRQALASELAVGDLTCRARHAQEAFHEKSSLPAHELPQYSLRFTASQQRLSSPPGQNIGPVHSQDAPKRSFCSRKGQPGAFSVAPFPSWNSFMPATERMCLCFRLANAI